MFQWEGKTVPVWIVSKFYCISQSGFHPSKLMWTIKLNPFTEKPALQCFRGISKRSVIDFQQVNFYSNHKFKERMKTWNGNLSATYDNHLLRLASFNAHFILLWLQKHVVTEEVFSLKVFSVWKFHSYCQRKYQTELENETREKWRESCPHSSVQLMLNIDYNPLTQIQPLKILIVIQTRMHPFFLLTYSRDLAVF